jgi:hypothetical protein
MAVHPPLRITSINMRRRNAATHALLNSTNNSHLLLIQEPWFNTIGTARKDTARQGTDVRGGVASPKWEILYPNYQEGKRPKAMAYARKRPHHDPTTPPFTIVPRLDVCAHPCIQVLDIVHDNEQWRVINVYHDVRDITCLQALLALDIDATTPTLVVGDFNAHSQTWSAPDNPRCQHARRIEEWAAANLLTLANTPGEITRRGAEHERDSVIDLAWYNEAAIQAGTFTGLQVDWAGSLGSDHAALHVKGHTREAPPEGDSEDNLGYVVDPEKSEEWIEAFKERSINLPFQLHPSSDEVEEAAASLTRDIQRTNEEIFQKRHPAHPKASPWWNAACDIAVQNLREAQTDDSRKTAHGKLKGTVRTAKRMWADDYIEKAQLWEVAAWRHGRRLNKVQSLQGPEGLAHSHEEVADILSHRFFSQDPPRVSTHFPDDPPPHPTRTLTPIDMELVETLLKR